MANYCKSCDQRLNERQNEIIRQSLTQFNSNNKRDK